MNARHPVGYFGPTSSPCADAERWGLMTKGATAPRPQSLPFNTNLSVPVDSFSPEALHELLATFEGRARVVGDRVVLEDAA